jgi:iron complex transport system substrate-binding protein
VAAREAQLIVRTRRNVLSALTFVAIATLAAAVGARPTPGPFQGGARLQAQFPQRIISLVPALTEMLFAIGAGPQVVAVSSFDHHPPDVETRPRVGALLDPDVERILSLKPDLVAIYGSQVDLDRQLARASIPRYAYRHAGLPAILTTLRDLGRVTGRAAAAEAVAADIERRLADVRQRTSRERRLRTLLVFGRERGALRRIYASGGRGFLHDMLEVAGGDNVFADVSQESVQATTETILARAPEVILELHEGAELSPGEARALAADWSRLPALPAVATGRVVIVSGEGLVVPGPRVAVAVERLARALHPARMAR